MEGLMFSFCLFFFFSLFLRNQTADQDQNLEEERFLSDSNCGQILARSVRKWRREGHFSFPPIRLTAPGSLMLDPVPIF